MISKKRKTNLTILESALRHLTTEEDKVESGGSKGTQATSGRYSDAPERSNDLSKDVSSMIDKVLPQRVKAKGIKKNELISTKRLLTQ